MQELSEQESALSNSEDYRSFIRRRSRLSWSIVGFSCGLVLVFNIVSKFTPALANVAVFAQGALSFGIVFAVLLIVINVFAAAYFVFWNNREHIRLSQVIAADFSGKKDT